MECMASSLEQLLAFAFYSCFSSYMKEGTWSSLPSLAQDSILNNKFSSSVRPSICEHIILVDMSNSTFASSLFIIKVLI